MSDERDMYEPPNPHRETPKEVGAERVRALRRTLTGDAPSGVQGGSDGPS